MDKLTEILIKIKERPNLYLGKPSVERLRAFINGYIVCLRDMDDKNKYDFYPGFDGFLQKKYNIKTTKGWDNIIQFYSGDEADAFNKFFVLFEEYKLKNNIS